MVGCGACKAAVDAAEARGQVVAGVGLGGTESHCDAAVRGPVAAYHTMVVPSLGAPQLLSAVRGARRLKPLASRPNARIPTAPAKK